MGELLSFMLIGLAGSFLLAEIANKVPTSLFNEIPPTRYSYYPFAIATPALTMLVALHFDDSWHSIPFIAFTWYLILITAIDIKHQLILDVFSITFMWLGLIFSPFSPLVTPEQAIWGAAVGYGFFWLLFHVYAFITKKEGMGFGDFKLLAGLGAWLGLMALPQIILIASVSGVVVTLAWSMARGKSLNSPMPFAPFLAIGGMVTLFFGNDLLRMFRL